MIDADEEEYLDDMRLRIAAGELVWASPMWWRDPSLPRVGPTRFRDRLELEPFDDPELIVRRPFRPDPVWLHHFGSEQALQKAKQLYAHWVVAEMVKRGDLAPATHRPCQGCGSQWALHWHHEDYDKPDVVIALCLWCHAQAHK